MTFRPTATATVRAALHATLFAITLCAASLASAGAAVPREPNSSGAQGEDEFVGPYARFNLSIGEIVFDDRIDGADVDTEVSGGFGLTAGYRLNDWLAAEFDFQFLGGQNNVEINNFNEEDSEFFAFTIGPKLYPLGLLDSEDVPDAFQPYAMIGLGGGEAEIGDDERSSFVARFILGIDFWIDERVGFFVEGGGYAADDNDIDGAGLFSLGVQARF